MLLILLKTSDTCKYPSTKHYIFPRCVVLCTASLVAVISPLVLFFLYQ